MRNVFSPPPFRIPVLILNYAKEFNNTWYPRVNPQCDNKILVLFRWESNSVRLSRSRHILRNNIPDFFFFFFLHVKQVVLFCTFPQFVIVTKYESKRFISVNSFNRIDLPFFFLFFRLYSFQSIDRHIIQLLFVFVPITCKRNIVFLWNVI